MWAATHKRKYNYVDEFLIFSCLLFTPSLICEYIYIYIYIYIHVYICNFPAESRRINANASRTFHFCQTNCPPTRSGTKARLLHYKLIQESRRQDTAWTSISGWTVAPPERRKPAGPSNPRANKFARLCARLEWTLNQYSQGNSSTVSICFWPVASLESTISKSDLLRKQPKCDVIFLRSISAIKRSITLNWMCSVFATDGYILIDVPLVTIIFHIIVYWFREEEKIHSLERGCLTSFVRHTYIFFYQFQYWNNFSNNRSIGEVHLYWWKNIWKFLKWDHWACFS